MLRHAGTKPAPTLEFSGTTGRPLATVGEEQYSASYNRTIETGGKRARRIEVAEIGVAVAQAEFDERLRQIGYAIAVLYADATAQQQRLQKFEQIVALNQESIRLTQARVREGDAAQLETQLLEVDLSRAEAERVTALAPPARGPVTAAVARGETLFTEIGCSSCHVPQLTTGPSSNPLFDRKPVALFSDLLLHDIGTGDDIEQADAKGSEIRTPALWGLRFRRPLLHDGSAPSVERAIERHRVEAANVTGRYARLSSAEKADLIAFLKAL